MENEGDGIEGLEGGGLDDIIAELILLILSRDARRMVWTDTIANVVTLLAAGAALTWAFPGSTGVGDGRHCRDLMLR